MRSIKINFNVFCVYLFAFSFFLPNRGAFVGFQYAIQCLITVLFFLLIFLKRKKISLENLPWWANIYLLIILLCVIKHFNTRSIAWNLFDILPALGALSIAPLVLSSKKRFDDFIDAILFTAFFYSLLCIFESIFKINIFDLITADKVSYIFVNEIRFGFARNRGLFDVSINNGAFLLMVECLCTYKMLDNKSKKYRIFFITIFLAAFLGLSRVVWIGLILSQTIIFLFLNNSKKIKFILSAVVLFCIFLSVGAMIPNGTINRVYAIISEMIETTINALLAVNTNSNAISQSGLYGIGARFQLWSWVFDATKDNIFWGKGYYETFRHVYSKDVIKTSIEVTWLYKLFRTGLVGMIGYAFFEINCILSAVKECITNRSNFDICFLAMIIGIFVAQFGYSAIEDINFFYLYVGLFFCTKKLFK